MTINQSTIKWCIVRIGDDFNWWVEEVSDPIYWDVDDLSIIDPRQLSHILELLEPLYEYGLKRDIVEKAFFKFKIDKKLKDNCVRLSRVDESIFSTQEKLFVLPDIIDEEKGHYADFLDHITKVRVKFINAFNDSDEKLTIEDLESDVRDLQQQYYMEGHNTHAFAEIADILEYTLGDDDDDDIRKPVKGGESSHNYPEIKDVEADDEAIEKDETMKWAEEEMGDDDDDEVSEKLIEALDDDDDDEIETENNTAPKAAKKKTKPAPASKKKPKKRKKKS